MKKNLFFSKNDTYTRVSAKRTPCCEKRISAHHEIELSLLIPNWWLKNLYDVIRRKFLSYTVKSFPLLSIGKEKRENKFKFSSSALEHFSTDPE